VRDYADRHGRQLPRSATTLFLLNKEANESQLAAAARELRARIRATSTRR
jgi:hypothetical protein